MPKGAEIDIDTDLAIGGVPAARVRLAQKVERVCAWLVVAIGVVILTGGALNLSALTRWGAHLPSTVPVTGLVFVTIGSGLLLATHRVVAMVIASAGLVLGLCALAARAANWRHPFETWWIGDAVLDPGRRGLPPGSTLLGLVVTSIAVMLVIVGRSSWAQIFAGVGAAIGWLAALSVLYGDRLSTISASSFPETATSLPAGVALLLAAAAVFAATPTEGLSGWISSESPGRRAVRRLLPIVLAVPLLLAALGRWTDLDGRLGEPRAWALLMTLVSLGICGVAVAAVPLIDEYAAAARRTELTEVRLDAALRAARVEELARSLAGAVTVDEVSEIVSGLATAVVNAHAASVGIIDHATRTLDVHHGPGVTQEVRERYANPSLETPLAFTEAARTGRIVLARDYEEYRQRYPDSDPSTAQLGRGGRASLPLVNRSGETFGVLGLSWDLRVDFDDTMMSTLATVAELVAQSLERARLTDEAALEARRNAELARLAEALATAHSTGDVLSFLADRITAPLDADTAVVGLLDREHNLLHRHFTSALQPMEQLLGTVPLDRELPLVVAADRGIPVLLEDRAQVEAKYPEALRVFDAAGIIATANLPLRNRRGESFGALGVAWLRPIVFDARLRGLLSTIAELAAQTLERAWLADSSEAERGRAEQLAKLAEALAVAQSTGEVEAVVRANAAGVLDARAALYIAAGDRVDGVDDDADDDGADDGGADATLSIPLIASDDDPLGVLVVEWDEPRVIDESLRSSLTTVAELLAQTLERVDLAEAEHRLIEGLQRRILKPFPAVAGFEATARYEPAAPRLGMGGDWYEGLALDDGARLGLIVGDVVGHGVDSAVEMTQLSGVLSTLLRVGVPLDVIFTRVHEVAQSLSIYATALVAVFDPATSQLELTTAGHLPPVLIDPSGVARLVAAPQHPMIGVGPTRPRSVVVDFGPGCTLVAFTDGLIERRDEALDQGLERLRGLCEELGALPGDELVDLIISTFRGDVTAEDDLAVVMVRAPLR